MEEYTLYLDESETHNYNKETNTNENSRFTIAGVICKKTYHDTVLKPKINFIKNHIWNMCGQDADYKNKILHELEMSNAVKKGFKKLKCGYNKVFKNKHIYNFTYDMLTEIIDLDQLVILAVCIDRDKLSECYDEEKTNDQFQIAMNMIIENYYHFLNSIDGNGYICYESMPKNQQDKITKRYQGIKYNGTMFYPARVINERIKGLIFKSKKDNVAGLQLADFIPNAVGRHVLDKHYTNCQTAQYSRA